MKYTKATHPALIICGTISLLATIASAQETAAEIGRHEYREARRMASADVAVTLSQMNATPATRVKPSLEQPVKSSERGAASTEQPWIASKIVLSKTKGGDNCAAPASTDFFTTSDASMYFWFLHRARNGDSIKVKWSVSTGKRGETPFGPFQAGSFCTWLSIPLSSWTTKDKIGDWTWEVLVNGASAHSSVTTLVGPSQPAIRTIVNSASYQEGRISPGALVSIIGSNLSASSAVASASPLPEKLSGVSVTFDGVPARIYSVSPTRIDVQAPWSLNRASSVVRVFSSNGGSNPYAATVGRSSPGVFPDYRSDKQAAVCRLNGDCATSQNPLKRGERVALFATGLGEVTNPPADGSRGNSNSRPSSPVSLSIGGVLVKDVQTVLSTSADPMDIGVHYVVFTVPAEVPNGDVRVALTTGASIADLTTVPVGGDRPKATAATLVSATHPGGSTNISFAPASTIVIRAKNLNPDAPTSIRFTGADGVSVESQSMHVTSSEVVALVPPIYNKQRNRFEAASGVTCAVVQNAAGQQVVSNSTKVNILAPPTSKLPPGELTAQLLASMMGGARQAQTAMVFKEMTTDGKFQSGNISQRTEQTASAIRPIMNAARSAGAGKQVNLATGNGRSLTLDPKSVALLDAMIASWVTSFRDADTTAEKMLIASANDVSLPVETKPNSGIREGAILQLLKNVAKCWELNRLADFYDGNRPCPSTTEIAHDVALEAVGAASDTVDHVVTNARKTLSFAKAVVPWMVPAGQAAEAAALIAQAGAATTAFQYIGQATAFAAAAAIPSDVEGREEMLELIGQDRFVKPLTDDLNSYLEGAAAKTGLEEGDRIYRLTQAAWEAMKDLDDSTERLRAGTMVVAKDTLNEEISLPRVALVNRIKGRVVDGASRAVADGVVSLTGSAQSLLGSAGVGTDGFYELLIPRNALANVERSAQLTYTIWRNSDSAESFIGNMVDIMSLTQTVPDKKVGGQPEYYCPAGLAC